MFIYKTKKIAREKKKEKDREKEEKKNNEKNIQNAKSFVFITLNYLECIFYIWQTNRVECRSVDRQKFNRDWQFILTNFANKNAFAFCAFNRNVCNYAYKYGTFCIDSIYST